MTDRTSFIYIDPLKVALMMAPKANEALEETIKSKR